MTTVSNKLTDGLDKVRDNKPAAPASNAQPASPTPPKTPARRKPVQRELSQSAPKPELSQSAPAPVPKPKAAERPAVFSSTRVWPD
ncbi:MAG: hypothetical protein ACP5Q0_05425 [Halothiobacillus sp.]